MLKTNLLRPRASVLAAAQQLLFTSADAKEGLAAYSEKRPPKFTGK
ncbi:MAG TPA: hypothetical protein VJN42_08190 [Candidatus Acidoferrum sp.]|nr:hypothetical protein [Candidatus Acidoferrum sp.]